jgi:large subunit ribosomal protein L22
MGKPSRERSLADTEAQAVAKNLRVSPQKLNLVAGLIRGKKVDQALADLEFSRKRIALDVRKCVMSAVANAENNHGLDVNALVVKEAWVGKNLVMKRFAARGRGRGASILKPFSQITVVVRQADETADAKAKGAKAKGKGAKTGAPAGAKAGKAAKDKPAAKAGAGKPAKAAAAKKETE